MVTADRLGRCDFFQEIDPSLLEALGRYFDVEQLPAGQTVFEEGAPGTHLYIVEEGSLEVVKPDITGAEHVLAELRRGQVVGEMAVMDLRPSSATVRAKADTTLLAISRDDLLKMLQEAPRAAAALILGVAHSLSERLRISSPRLL